MWEFFIHVNYIPQSCAGHISYFYLKYNIQDSKQNKTHTIKENSYIHL